MGALSLASVVMLISIYEDSTLRKVMYCIGRSLAGLLWGVIYIYTSEIYPTNVRGLGAGLGSGKGQINSEVSFVHFMYFPREIEAM